MANKQKENTSGPTSQQEPEGPLQDKILTELQALRQNNEQLTQQIAENNKQLLNQYLTTLLEKQEQCIKKYNLDFGKAFQIQLLKTVWEYVLKTEQTIKNIISELDKNSPARRLNMKTLCSDHLPTDQVRKNGTIFESLRPGV